MQRCVDSLVQTKDNVSPERASWSRDLLLVLQRTHRVAVKEMSLAEKRVIVIGGATGIGFPVAEFGRAQAAAVAGCRFSGRTRGGEARLPYDRSDGSIAISSVILSQRPSYGAPLPTAVAGAIEHLVRGLALNLAPLRVNAPSPGFTLTDQSKKMGNAMLQSIVAKLPIPRGAAPVETAKAYIYYMLNDYAMG